MFPGDESEDCSQLSLVSGPKRMSRDFKNDGRLACWGVEEEQGEEHDDE